MYCGKENRTKETQWSKEIDKINEKIAEIIRYLHFIEENQAMIARILSTEDVKRARIEREQLMERINDARLSQILSLLRDKPYLEFSEIINKLGYPRYVVESTVKYSQGKLRIGKNLITNRLVVIPNPEMITPENRGLDEI